MEVCRFKRGITLFLALPGANKARGLQITRLLLTGERFIRAEGRIGEGSRFAGPAHLAAIFSAGRKLVSASGLTAGL
jgi:hypothetical protein